MKHLASAGFRLGLACCLGIAVSATTEATARAAEPRQVFLWFADGGPVPASVPATCGGTPPPAYRCTFAPNLLECRAAIYDWLDRWYADFNVVFTYWPPRSGPFDTIVISHEGAWCFSDARTTSRSPLPTCMSVESGWVVVFQCGEDPRRCASIIAQEQAHLVGLAHTPSNTDIMNDAFLPDHDGFEDAENPVAGVQCRRPQNSYRLMLERLGPWPGGPKPRPEETLDPLDAGAGLEAETFPAADAMPDVDETDTAGPAPDSRGPEPSSPPNGGRSRSGSSGCGCDLSAGGSVSASGPVIVSLLFLFGFAGGARTQRDPRA